MNKEIILLLKSKIVKNSVWLFILQVFNTIIPLITIPYITRVLETESYGIFSLALNWITYFQVIVEYGFGFTGARKVSIYGADGLQELYSRIITARLILLSGSFVVMNVFSIILKVTKEQYFSMNILFLIIIGVAFQLTWLFQGMQDMKLIAIINAISRVMSVFFVFLLVQGPTHLYIYCGCYSVTFIFSAFLGILLAKKKYNLKVKLCSLKEAVIEIKDGRYLFVSQAMSKIFSGIGTTVLGVVATSSIIGVYSAIYKIPHVIVLFFNPVSQALYPHISMKFSKSFKAGAKTVKQVAYIVIPAFVLVALGIVICRKPLIMVVFGENYLEYSVIILPLVLWMVFSIINNFLGIQFLVASGNQQIYSKAFLISSLVAVVMNIILGYVGGIYGVSIAAPIGEMLLTILLCIGIRKIMCGGI